MSDSPDELQAQLLNEYTALDPSTLLAIISDYDLSDVSQLNEARQTLDILKESADTVETHDFDASASSAVEQLPGDGDREERYGSGSSSTKSLPAEWASQTDETSTSQALSSLDLDDAYSEGDHAFGRDLDDLDEDGKVSLLKGVFPVLSEFSIKWTLNKCKWNANLAVDELMTQSFLETHGVARRGVEAFSEPDLTLNPKKRKGKKKRSNLIEDGSGSPTSELPEASKWNTATQDIDFISKRTGVPTSQISSLYHKNGTSVAATILAVVTAHQEMKIENDDPILHSNAIDLAHEFPSVAFSTLEAIIQITFPSSAYAHELAKAIVPRPSNKPRIQIELRHAPLNLDPATKPSSSPRPYNYDNDVPLEEASAQAMKHYQARDTAFQQANAAFRKGKSDHLMGGAAAYYSQQGRDADALARSAKSAAADALILQQSSRTELDLHGLGVIDAKRITQERVGTWWHEIGSRPGGGRSYYRIVIGRGNHSDRGVAKIGPAVGRMLIRDGWKVEVGDNNGVLNVLGVAKKK